jgi:hypothetical protein
VVNATSLQLELTHPAAVPDPQASDPEISNLEKKKKLQI